jgi:hypothetical protein
MVGSDSELAFESETSPSKRNRTPGHDDRAMRRSFRRSVDTDDGPHDANRTSECRRATGRWGRRLDSHRMGRRYGRTSAAPQRRRRIAGRESSRSHRCDRTRRSGCRRRGRGGERLGKRRRRRRRKIGLRTCVHRAEDDDRRQHHRMKAARSHAVTRVQISATRSGGIPTGLDIEGKPPASHQRLSTPTAPLPETKYRAARRRREEGQRISVETKRGRRRLARSVRPYASTIDAGIAKGSTERRWPSRCAAW